LDVENEQGLTCRPTQVPGLLGTTENELGLRKWLEEQGHTLVTTSDKEGENSTFDRELVDAEVIITTP
jgi:formate dehydrogenase